MALPTNTFTTYSATGNREDLSDMIFRIDPTDTPFMTGIEKTKATAVNHEWQTQALAAANAGNAQLEGDDATADATTPTVRLGNIADQPQGAAGLRHPAGGRACRARQRDGLPGDAQRPRAQ